MILAKFQFIRRWVFIIPAIVFVLVAGVLLSWESPKPDFLTPPDPNAFDLLLAASEALDGAQPVETNKLEEFVVNNRAVFDQVTEALKHPSAAPPHHYSQSPSVTMTSTGDMAALKLLAMALLNKGAFAEQEVRWGDAAEAYVETIWIGRKVEVGTQIHLLTGAGMELAALKRLGQLTPRLNSEQLAETVSALREANAARISWDEVMKREGYLFESNATFLQRLGKQLQGGQTRMTGDVHERYLRNAAYMEVVATAMDARRYTLETGKPPSSVNELIPDYAPAVPLDPHTGQALLLRQTPEGALVIYSAGPDGKDDLGGNDDVTSALPGNDN